jgi:hypothetical protein
MKPKLTVNWKKLLWQSRPNPWQEVARLLLIYGLLIAVWLHSGFAVILITLAIIINPLRFPIPKNPQHFIHRIKSGEKLWLQSTPPLLKNLARVGEIAILLGLIIAAWQNHLFEAILLTAGLTSYKLYFMFYLTLLYDTREIPDRES